MDDLYVPPPKHPCQGCGNAAILRPGGVLFCPACGPQALEELAMRAWQAGLVALREMASMLGMEQADALALAEARGFLRPVGRAMPELAATYASLKDGVLASSDMMDALRKQLQAYLGEMRGPQMDPVGRRLRPAWLDRERELLRHASAYFEDFDGKAGGRWPWPGWVEVRDPCPVCLAALVHHAMHGTFRSDGSVALYACRLCRLVMTPPMLALARDLGSLDRHLSLKWRWQGAFHLPKFLGYLPDP